MGAGLCSSAGGVSCASLSAPPRARTRRPRTKPSTRAPSGVTVVRRLLHDRIKNSDLTSTDIAIPSFPDVCTGITVVCNGVVLSWDAVSGIYDQSMHEHTYRTINTVRWTYDASPDVLSEMHIFLSFSECGHVYLTTLAACTPDFHALMRTVRNMHRSFISHTIHATPLGGGQCRVHFGPLHSWFRSYLLKLGWQRSEVYEVVAHAKSAVNLVP